MKRSNNRKASLKLKLEITALALTIRLFKLKRNCIRNTVKILLQRSKAA